MRCSPAQSLDITGVTKLADKLAQEYQENPTAIKGGLAIAAAGVAGFVLFNEVELVLEVRRCSIAEGPSGLFRGKKTWGATLHCKAHADVADSLSILWV